jgi:hypothetical protein
MICPLCLTDTIVTEKRSCLVFNSEINREKQMREKIYKALLEIDTSRIIGNADPSVKLGIELTIKKYGQYRMRCPDKPCNKCVVQIVCQIKKIYDLGDLNIIRAINSEICDRIDLWNEIVKCEEIKEKFLEKSNEKKWKDEIHGDQNYNVYLAMCITNFEKSKKYDTL